MGVLSDLIIASEGEIQSVLKSPAPLKEFDGADVKGLDTVKLGTLHELLLGTAYDEVEDAYNTEVAAAGRDGPWLFKILPVLVQALAPLSGESLAECAQKWGSTEEFSIDGIGPAEAHQLLEILSDLALRSISLRKNLYLWISL